MKNPLKVIDYSESSKYLVIGKEVIEINIESVRIQYEDQLMRLPNVTGVGIGQKKGKEVILVFVTHKVPEPELQPQEVIPKLLAGYETDVQDIGVVTAQGQS